ncbi:MAG: hypothetical protein M1821_008202 [Bathelium mastoideum]|nr:MAG: hypothetical protein M1821_008202 [Bathelium mastoideum]
MVVCFYCFTATWTAVVAAFAVVFGTKSEAAAQKSHRQKLLGIREHIRTHMGDIKGKVSSGKPLSEHLHPALADFWEEANGKWRRRGSRANAPDITSVLSEGGVSLEPVLAAVEEQVQKHSAIQFFEFLKQWFLLFHAALWKRGNGNRSSGSSEPHLLFGLVLFLDIWIVVSRTIVQYLCLLVSKKCPRIDYPPLIPLPKVHFSKTHREDPDERSRYIQYAIYVSNVLCILWSILATELILVWNNVDGIYNVSSTGQLIPFIIGVVGLMRLLQAISVRRSAVFSTEVLVKLLDVEPENSDDSRSDIAVASTALSTMHRRQRSRSMPSLHDNHEAVHRHRGIRRCKSISIIRPGQNLQQILPNENLTAVNAAELTADAKEVGSRQFHLEHRFDFGTLQRAYGDEGIETHRLVDGRKFWIVKDWRRHRSKGETGTSRLNRLDSIVSAASRNRPVMGDAVSTSGVDFNGQDQPGQPQSFPSGFWKRIVGAASELWKRYSEHWEEKKRSSFEKTKKTGQHINAGHQQRLPSPKYHSENWTSAGGLHQLKKGYRAQSLPLLLSGLAATLTDFFNYLHYERCAHYASQFSKLMEEAKEIRQAHKIGGIRAGAQHDDILEKWRHLFDEDMWTNIKAEFSSRGKDIGARPNEHRQVGNESEDQENRASNRQASNQSNNEVNNVHCNESFRPNGQNGPRWKNGIRKDLAHLAEGNFEP